MITLFRCNQVIRLGFERAKARLVYALSVVLGCGQPLDSCPIEFVKVVFFPILQHIKKWRVALMHTGLLACCVLSMHILLMDVPV